MGFTTTPGLRGEEVLVQACSQCHNQRLDQTLSRAGFHVDLDELTHRRAHGQLDAARLGHAAGDAEDLGAALVGQAPQHRCR